MPKKLTPEEQTAFFEGLLAKAVKPYAEQLASVWESGAIPIVTHDLTPQGGVNAARHFGWKGGTEPFVLSQAAADLMARHCMGKGDFVTSRWLGRVDSLRIFAIVHGGSTFLINYVPGEGFSLEPNSTDSGWKN